MFKNRIFPFKFQLFDDPILPDDKSVAKMTRCQVEWQIQEFVRLPTDPDYSINSEWFSMSNITWRMCMFPHSNSNSIAVFFEIQPFLVEKQRVATTIGIKSFDGSVHVSVNEVLDFGRSKSTVSAGFIDRKPILDAADIWLPDGHLTVVCNISLQGAAVSNPKETDPILVQNFEDLLLNEREADVTIKVGDKQFRSHRSILVARSVVFAKLFLQDMDESKTGVVEIADCDADSFREFLLYLYTGKTEQVTPDNAPGLYSIADEYSVEELKVKCVKCMRSNLSIGSTCGVLVLASMHKESALLQSATDFFVKNMKEIIQTPKWSEFLSKHSHLVQELLEKTADHVKM